MNPIGGGRFYVKTAILILKILLKRESLYFEKLLDIIFTKDLAGLFILLVGHLENLGNYTMLSFIQKPMLGGMA